MAKSQSEGFSSLAGIKGRLIMAGKLGLNWKSIGTGVRVRFELEGCSDLLFSHMFVNVLYYRFVFIFLCDRSLFLCWLVL